MKPGSESTTMFSPVAGGLARARDLRYLRHIPAILTSSKLTDIKTQKLADFVLGRRTSFLPGTSLVQPSAVVCPAAFFSSGASEGSHRR